MTQPMNEWLIKFLLVALGFLGGAGATAWGFHETLVENRAGVRVNANDIIEVKKEMADLEEKIAQMEKNIIAEIRMRN